MMITDEAGRPLAVTDLNGAELRALRVLSSAGMIPPLNEPAAATGQNPATSGKGSAGGQGVLVERDFTRQPRKAALKQPRQGTATARPATKAS
jgi:hypothetical protein